KRPMHRLLVHANAIAFVAIAFVVLSVTRTPAQQPGNKYSEAPVFRDRSAETLPKGAATVIGTNWLRDSQSVGCVIFSADGRRLAWGNEMGVVQIAEAATGRPLLELKPNPSRWTPVTEMAFSPDGRFLATGGYWARDVRVFDLERREVLCVFPNTVDRQERW